MGRVVKTKDNFRNRSKVNTLTMTLGVIRSNQNNRPFLLERRCESSNAKSRHRSIIEDMLSLLVCISCMHISSRLVTFNHYCFDVNVCDSYFRRCSSSVSMLNSLTIRVTDGCEDMDSTLPFFYLINLEWSTSKSRKKVLQVLAV